jgi:hypothetical protein
MVCFSFVGCPHRTLGSYAILALSMLCIIICIRFILYVLAEVCCGDTGTIERTDQRDTREVGETREIATMQVTRELILRLYPPWLTHQRPEIPSTNPEVNQEWDSKLVISAGGDHVSGIARPCPLNPPIEEPK